MKKAKKIPRTTFAVHKQFYTEFRKICKKEGMNVAFEIRKMFRAWITKHGGEI